MKKIAIYPGSFDPVTYGHINVIKRATQVFDKVIVAVAQNMHKKPLFSVKERFNMLERVTKDLKGVEVDKFNGLVVDYARKRKVYVLIRGLRMISDFEYEFQMALTNRRLACDIETVFMMPSAEYSFISSKLLKEIAQFDADLSEFLPDFVSKALKERLQK